MPNPNDVATLLVVKAEVKDRRSARNDEYHDACEHRASMTTLADIAGRRDELDHLIEHIDRLIAEAKKATTTQEPTT